MKQETEESRAADARAARRNIIILFGGATIAMISIVVAAVLFLPE